MKIINEIHNYNIHVKKKQIYSKVKPSIYSTSFLTKAPPLPLLKNYILGKIPKIKTPCSRPQAPALPPAPALLLSTPPLPHL